MQTGKAVKTAAPVAIPAEKDVNWDKPKVAVPGKPGLDFGGDKATVLMVQDGDTAKFKRNKDGSAINCRITGFDAPETDKSWAGKRGAQPHAEESLNKLKDLISKGEIRVTVTTGPSERNFNRSLCKVTVEGKDVTRDMLEAGAGMLWQYGKDANRNPEDIAANQRAQAGHKGIYGLPRPPIDPVVWKHTPLSQTLQ